MEDYYSTMEPVILVDKRKNKETHIITSTRNSFNDLVESAKRINKGLYEGAWDLSYLDPTTHKPVPLDEEQEVAELLEKDINTFYWKYKKLKVKVPVNNDHLNKEYRNKAHEWIGDIFGDASSAAKRKESANLQVLGYAHFTSRCVAWAIDAVIISMISKLFGIETTLIVAWLYFALMESSKHQATIGKLVMSLRVTDLNGRKLNFLQASIRHIGKWVSNLTFGIGYLMAATTEKRQALHDMFANTIVLEVIDKEHKQQHYTVGK